MAGSGAKGRHQTFATIATKTDTTIITAPTEGTVSIFFLQVSVVNDAGNSDEVLKLEDGVGGTVIGSIMSKSYGNLRLNPPYQHPFTLTKNTALNAETSGTGNSTYDVVAIYEVR